MDKFQQHDTHRNSTRQVWGLIVTLILTALFIKNIVLNALLWHEVTPPDRDTFLQF